MNDNAELRNRVETLERHLRAIVDNASPSSVVSFAGEKNMLVFESLINEARELLEKSHE